MTQMKLLNEAGDEVPMFTTVEDVNGERCFVEALVDRWDVGPMVLISGKNAGAHLVNASQLRCRIDRS